MHVRYGSSGRQDKTRRENRMNTCFKTWLFIMKKKKRGENREDDMIMYLMRRKTRSGETRLYLFEKEKRK